MRLNGKRIMLTGAAGGMGSILARLLAEREANCALIDVDAEQLELLCQQLPNAIAVPANLSIGTSCQAAEALGGVDVLINLAGLMSFCTYEDEDLNRLERLIQVNLVAPMALSQAVLPTMLAQDSGQIVNIGSMFGSIGFAYFAAYSASKFGLRGFSQALRRELLDTNVSVTYISPRAVKTPINTSAIMEMNVATKTNMDEPDVIAGKILQAIEADRKEAYLGFPESLFARLNGLWPALIDTATRAQNQVARSFAKP
ncbi:MAG: SDR family oxidoreductase [Gammaproteobacteria bacterium]|jgi:short-subunit dehydrogenase|nr:short chain dehydrogenase [Chromatiales bacterium]MDP6416356.1 SDR family oxidoreductase [Gammaproteobacteria bacterium]MDP6674915.1 SDR family oxidoreductase [Gammaproteobacteria bacterium]